MTPAPPTSGGPYDLLFRDVRLFDGERSIERTSVAVAGGLIAAIGEVDDVAAAEVVAGDGFTLLPGFIDAHTHAFPGALEQALQFGVTTELDMFADPSLAAALRQEARRRTDISDLRSAGTGATPPGGHPTQLIAAGYLAPFPTLASPSEAGDWVAARVGEGSDYIKLMIEDGSVLGQHTPTLGASTVAAVVHAARRLGQLTVAHAMTCDAAIVALEAGVDGLAHVFVDRPIEDEVVAAAREADAFICPTLTVIELGADPEKAAAALREDPAIGPLLDPGTRDALMQPPPRLPMDLDIALDAVARLHEAGVTILAGTDAAGGPRVHGAALHRELELLVLAGIPAVEALASATSLAAARFGLADRGWVYPGQRADLVLVRGDPLSEIRSTRSIAAVWRGGQRLRQGLAA